MRHLLFTKWKRSEIVTENDKKNPNFPIFKVFMQFLSDFRPTLRIGMLNTFTKVAACCLVVIKDEIISVFWMKKVSNWHRSWQKSLNFSNFKVFMQFFSQFLTNSGNWNVGQGQQAMNLLSSMLSDRLFQFFEKKLSGIDIEKDKNSKTFPFSPFLFNFCHTIDRLRALEW